MCENILINRETELDQDLSEARIIFFSLFPQQEEVPLQDLQVFYNIFSGKYNELFKELLRFAEKFDIEKVGSFLCAVESCINSTEEHQQRLKNIKIEHEQNMINLEREHYQRMRMIRCEEFRLRLY